MITGNLPTIIVSELEIDLRSYNPAMRVRRDTNTRIDIDIVIRKGAITEVSETVVAYQRALNTKYKHLGVYVTFSLIQG